MREVCGRSTRSKPDGRINRCVVDVLPLTRGPIQHEESGLNLDVFPDAFKDVADATWTHLNNEQFTDEFSHDPIRDSVTTMQRQMIWYTDNPDFKYVMHHRHFQGLEPRAVPFWLSPMVKRVNALTGQDHNAVLVTRYERDDEMFPHSDNDMWLGKSDFAIPIVSVGMERVFKLDPREKEKHKSIRLPASHGSLIVMHPPMNDRWSHSMPRYARTKEPITHSVLYTLTFRNVKPDLIDRMPRPYPPVSIESLVHGMTRRHTSEFVYRGFDMYTQAYVFEGTKNRHKGRKVMVPKAIVTESRWVGPPDDQSQLS